jgi:chaperonin cofactor prefoldin
LVKQENNTRERLTQLQENLQKDINQQMGSSPQI